MKSYAEFLSLSKLRIQEYKRELKKTIIPFDQMTTEDMNEIFQETKLDKKYVLALEAN